MRIRDARPHWMKACGIDVVDLQRRPVECEVLKKEWSLWEGMKREMRKLKRLLEQLEGKEVKKEDERWLVIEKSNGKIIVKV